jgi:hypothetical protein
MAKRRAFFAPARGVKNMCVFVSLPKSKIRAQFAEFVLSFTRTATVTSSSQSLTTPAGSATR